jgi:hypothetical protein
MRWLREKALARTVSEEKEKARRRIILVLSRVYTNVRQRNKLFFFLIKIVDELLKFAFVIQEPERAKLGGVVSGP